LKTPPKHEFDSKLEFADGRLIGVGWVMRYLL